mgnify:CR=1 FL=1|tara:strand:+ start:240 stop:611 length:372 start_codon:yes stop_codon:yes gene_type:complete
MTDLKTSCTKEQLELTQMEFPNIPLHMIKTIYDFHKINPTYLQDNPDIFNKSFSPEGFTETLTDAVNIHKPEDLPEATPVEGVNMMPISSLTEEQYNEQLEAMKKEELKADLEAENKNAGSSI